MMRHVEVGDGAVVTIPDAWTQFTFNGVLYQWSDEVNNWVVSLLDPKGPTLLDIANGLADAKEGSSVPKDSPRAKPAVVAGHTSVGQ